MDAAHQAVGQLERTRQESERRLHDVGRSIQEEAERLKGEVEKVAQRKRELE
jgi:hypothetical protein